MSIDPSVGEQRRKALAIARDMLYPDEVIERLHKAKTSSEIDRILTTARRDGIKKDDKARDAEIIKNKRKAKPKKKSDVPHALLCPNCRKNMADDYYILNATRIKDGLPYNYSYGIIMCDECYDKLYRAQQSLVKSSY